MVCSAGCSSNFISGRPEGERESVIVGDRKQSIYVFRGADVDVFREMTKGLVAAGGEERPLLQIRSQPPLIKFYNYLLRDCFSRMKRFSVILTSWVARTRSERCEARVARQRAAG
jgi:ATP-dependent exoDNAse (exonuclease V) beta subunit